MRILLDLQGCQSLGSRERGIGRYSLALAQALVRRGSAHEFWLLLNAAFADTIAPIRSAFEGLVPPERIMEFHVPPGCGEALSPAGWRTRSAEAIRRYAIGLVAPDVVHVSSLFEGLGDDSAVLLDAPRGGPAVAVTVYDFIPYLHADRFLTDAATRAWYLRKLESLRHADVLLGISESACEEARRVLADRAPHMVNISSAADGQLFQPGDPRGAAARLGIQRPFVMYTGGTNWRKNLQGLVAAFALLPAGLRSSLQLAIVCHAQAHAKTEVLAAARKAGLPPEAVVFTDYVSDADLADLYRSCELFVFPSLHEGFGLPALEAMMCGAPVIASNASSIPEVIGRADALFDPRDPRAIAALMQRALEDEPFRASLRAHARTQSARFSWDETARRALEAIEDLPRRSAVRATQPKQRPRLAMHSPLPPSESGIGQYTCDLLPHLRADYEIELVCDGDRVTLPPHLRDIPVRSTSWFREHAAGYDRIVYQWGNSVIHAPMFALLRDHPGTVVLHDFYLSGVLNWMEELGVAPGIFRRELFGSHGGPALAYERTHGREAAIRRYPCNRFVVERANGLIVHSRFALEAAREWCGTNDARHWRCIPPLRAIAPPQDRDEARRALGLAPDDLLVCSFGHVGPTKQTLRLLHAWLSSTLARDRRCRLVLVGGNTRPPYGDEVEKLVRANPGQFSITGFADRAAYERHLRAADAAVQLRTMARGETSGAVLDALAFGVPLVLNANGAMAEYPQEIVLRLPDDFEDAQLVQALERLHEDSPLRRELSAAGQAWVRAHNDPAAVARQYRDAIEAFAAPHRPQYWNLVDEIGALGPPPREDDRVDTAVAIAATRLPA